mgnify:CR=1 FL=1
MAQHENNTNCGTSRRKVNINCHTNRGGIKYGMNLLMS